MFKGNSGLCQKHKHECANIGRPARTYLHQLCVDTGCNLEDLPRIMAERENLRTLCC